MTWENSVSVILHNDSTESLYTGDIVTGVITLDLKKDLKVDCLYMEIIGISKAQWTRFTPTIPYLKIYSEKKKIFFVKQENLFFEDLQTDKSLRPGVYSHPFHFALPHNLPSTFNSSVASVNYHIKIKSKPINKVRKVIPFNVLANVNLNNINDKLEPCVYEFQRSFKTTKATVLVLLRTYKCFAPRQIIPFEFIIKNENQVKIKKICVALVQKLHYTVSSGYADDERTIHEEYFTKMENTMTEVCSFNMEIPHTAPSSVNDKDPMIDISYELRIEVFFSYHINLKESIPVIVAAVPVIHNEFHSEK